MNEKTTINFKEISGFRINKEIDITTGKVTINGIEITSVEDWDKVTHSIVELQKRIDKAVEYIKHYESIRGYYEYVECEYDEYNYEEDLKEELLEILKGEKE